MPSRIYYRPRGAKNCKDQGLAKVLTRAPHLRRVRAPAQQEGSHKCSAEVALPTARKRLLFHHWEEAKVATVARPSKQR